MWLLTANVEKNEREDSKSGRKRERESRWSCAANNFMNLAKKLKMKQKKSTKHLQREKTNNNNRRGEHTHVHRHTHTHSRDYLYVNLEFGNRAERNLLRIHANICSETDEGVCVCVGGMCMCPCPWIWRCLFQRWRWKHTLIHIHY